ncbi:MAG TPA: hypothetical protein VFT22_05490 [Kofleriaceae bacterium]|nr:hypothetical protein [Kofleriaceae bacterium]
MSDAASRLLARNTGAAQDTDDEAALVAWLRLAGTRGSDEIATGHPRIPLKLNNPGRRSDCRPADDSSGRGELAHGPSTLTTPTRATCASKEPIVSSSELKWSTLMRMPPVAR